MKRDPQRWLDTELPARLRRALESAAEDGGQSGELERLDRRLAIALGADWGAWQGELSRVDALPRSGRPPTPSHPTPAAPPGGAPLLTQGVGLGVKGVLALSLSVTLGVAALHTAVQHAGGVDRRPPARPPAAAAAAQARAPERSAAATAKAAVEPAGDAMSSSAAPPSARARRTRPAREPGLSAEVEQLDAIREHMQDAPALALQAASAHERRFPRGELAQERELLRIETLFRLGRSEEARARAQKLVDAPAGGSYRAQVQRLIDRYTATGP